MRIRLALVSSLLLLSTARPVNADSMFGYDLAVAKVDVGGRIVTIAPHRQKKQLLMQKAISSAFSRPEVWTIDVYREAAERFVAPVGCGIERVEAISVLGGTWYAVYVCPADVDLYRLIRSQKSRIKAGEPLVKGDIGHGTSGNNPKN